MKKILLILFLCSVNITAQKLDRKAYYEYTQDVEFRIYTIYKQRMISKDLGAYDQHIVAEKGQRFIQIVFEFKNNSTEAQIIDFENIFLRDENGELHKIDFVLKSMKLTAGISELKQILKPNKKRKIIAQFRSSFPKDEIIDELVVGERIIQLNYN